MVYRPCAGATRPLPRAPVTEPDLERYFRDSLQALERAVSDRQLLSAILAITQTIAKALRAGGKLMLAGNGGSAADAQHIAAEFLSRFAVDRAPLAAIALTTDTAALTAIGNDYGYEYVFERQLRGLGRKGDVFIALSTSGRSANVLAALKAARAIGITNIGFTGTGGSAAMQPLCDLMLIAPSDQTAIIQQIYMTAAHAICAMVERDMFKTSR
jgi:D-sedoheptulose 7-phosphate isomerase